MLNDMQAAENGYPVQQGRQDDLRWLRWSLAQALAQSIHRIPQKKAAMLGTSTMHPFVMTGIAGVLQATVGVAMALATGVKLKDTPKNIVGSCLFGMGAFAAMTCGNISFQLGGEIGIVTFIATMSIVPGAIIDHVFFRHHMHARGWVGIAVFLLAAYSMLDWPSLDTVMHLPPWLWFALAIPFTNAVNEGITQSIKDVHAFVLNFWGGITTIGCCAGALLINTALYGPTALAATHPAFWAWSVLLGLCVIGIWLFNLISYRSGATIALKKLVVSTVYLVIAMTIGIALFEERLTLAKGTALALYPIAYLLVRQNTGHAVACITSPPGP